MYDFSGRISNQAKNAIDMELIPEKINRFILDMLFPIRCLLCGKDDFWICPSCIEKIELLPYQFCPYCEKYLSWNGQICATCEKKQPLSKRIDALLVSTSYKDKDIAKLIHYFKYSFIQDLALPLGEIMLKTFRQNNISLPDLIIPVPLHRRRLKWRGFNQAELLADYLSENLAPGMTLEVRNDILVRKYNRKPQKRIKEYKKRLENIAGIFLVENPEAIKKQEVLLVDDVATTGSTLFECAKVLKQAGAKKVHAIVIARQNFSSNK